MIASAALEGIQSVIQNGNKFLLTTHLNADGDGIGSEIALACHLRDLGKEVHIFNHSPTPENVEFLDLQGDIRIFDPQIHCDLVREMDAAFILDISDWERLRDLGKLLRTLTITKICIDHHPAEDRMGEIDIILPDASSTGEIMYELLTRLGARFQGKIVEALYTAVLTDTGSFRFSNTNPRSHEIAAELIARGVKPHHIYQEVYERQPAQKMRLLGQILSNLNFAKNGRLVWFVVTQEMFRATGTQPRDTEGFADFPRSIDGVELCLMFMETETGKVKISFRSKGRVVINGLANRFGGGGHPYASGALVEGNLQQVVTQVVSEAKELFA
ncbi:MAG: bifunctional oligoribonuclease/PAP phosphatase NrnA [candidate division KSB1 bacterium]|nr:bifunctional oligoribonuclease/PAP phosphatase NrnA [candidate division KSB1 bacterium]MDZ7303891.1 bifunctional oligoribonuclease/PAP phosphatase NrnA [candidate division KSB1 bacterium]MDZ7313185.1 bifunctional oligoribonuclease/PAP phosphatase NrnA [candidate division KSB1 bacterium]